MKKSTMTPDNYSASYNYPSPQIDRPSFSRGFIAEKNNFQALLNNLQQAPKNRWNFSGNFILARYFWRDYVKNILFATIILLLIILLGQTLTLLPLFITSGFQVFSLLKLMIFYIPQGLTIMLPLIVSSAVLFTTRKHMTDHEIFIARYVGLSIKQMLGIVLNISFWSFILLLLLKLYVSPLGLQAYSNSRLLVSQNILKSFVEEGRFFSPSEGFTIYVGKKNFIGNLEDVFIVDKRDTNYPVIISAKKGVAFTKDNNTILSLIHGTQFDISGDKTRQLKFERYNMDISSFEPATRHISSQEFTINRLWRYYQSVQSNNRPEALATLVKIAERINFALLGLLPPLVIYLLLCRCYFNRDGRYSLVAIFSISYILTLMVLHLLLYNFFRNHVELFYLMFLPALFNILLLLILLWYPQKKLSR